VEAAAVVMPIDGSEFADRAGAVASRLALALGVRLHLLAVAADESEAERLAESRPGFARRVPDATFEVVTDRDVAVAISAAAERLSGVVCMASHGAGRSAALVGSTALGVLAGGRPVVVVGPRFEDPWEPTSPVRACVDGSPRSEAIIPVALGWARSLGAPLTITTVAEPIPAPTPGSPWRRGHGPDTDADRYVDDLAARWSDHAVSVRGSVVYDPIGVVKGLVDHLRHQPASLIVVGTRGRRGLGRLLLGSVAAELVQHAPVPVLVAPLPAADGEH
jgi:nucleotide-binding universal stress UspA family protein